MTFTFPGPAGGFGPQVDPPRAFTVWKFALTPDKFDNGCAVAVIKMPTKARILSVETVDNDPVVYALVETDNVEVERTFVIVPTGGSFGEHANALTTSDVGGDYFGPLRFAGTFQVSRKAAYKELPGGKAEYSLATTLVFHVFAYPEGGP